MHTPVAGSATNGAVIWRNWVTTDATVRCACSSPAILTDTTDTTDTFAAHNRLGADVAQRAADRLQRPVTRTAAPIQSSAQRREDLDHVAHQVIVYLAVVEHHQPAAMRGQ